MIPQERSIRESAGEAADLMNSFLVLHGYALTTAMRNIRESLLCDAGLKHPHAVRSLDYGEITFYLRPESPAEDHAELCRELTNPRDGALAPALLVASPWAGRLVRVAPDLELVAIVRNR
jgi:hypothetical protein